MNDTISRKQTLEHLKKRLYESALNNDGIASKIFEEIADNRVQIWVDEIPPSPTVTADTDTISRQKVISTINVLRPRCDTDDIDDYHDLLVETMEVLPPSPSRQKDGKTMDKKTLIDNLIKILPENADITYATVSWWDEDDREHKNWDTEELCEGT